VSRCSVKMTSFWCGEGVGGGIGTGAIGGWRFGDPMPDGGRGKDFAEQAGEFAPLGVGAAAADASAWPSSPFRVSISMRSSAIERAAVA
jgi:hypothetical protein